jgi:hypothetical protein
MRDEGEKKKRTKRGKLMQTITANPQQPTSHCT